MAMRGNGSVQTPQVEFHVAEAVGAHRKGVGNCMSREASADERGATIVEMAIVLPLLLLLIIGMLELGLAFRSFLTVSAAARDGSRVASLAGNEIGADCATLVEVGGTLATGGILDGLDRVVIFKAEPGGGAPVASNVYTLNSSGDPSVCTTWNRTTNGYPEATRQTISGPGSPLDIIGVRIVSDESWVTGLFPFRGTFTVDESSLSRMEPEAYE